MTPPRTDERCVSFLKRAYPEHYHDFAAGAVSSAPARLIRHVRLIGFHLAGLRFAGTV